MEKRLKKYFAALLALFICLGAYAQGNVYTRKARLADFPTRTVKVVVGDGSILEMSVKDAVSTHWRISPYEFCTQSDYEKGRSDNSFYFITLVKEDGVVFLSLEKGGKGNDSDNLKKPFEVVRVPIASVEAPTGRELMCMSAFVDIMQTFVEDAMGSDKIAYAGLGYYNGAEIKGKTIHLGEDADEIFEAQTPDALIGITIAPVSLNFSSSCYKMLISSDTHELCWYKKSKYTGSIDASFTDKEIKQFKKKNGIIAR